MATTFAVPEAVRAVLRASELGQYSGRAAWWLRLPAKMDRKLYVATNKVIEAVDGKWSREDAAHVFERDPREALGLAVETGKAENRKQTLQAFYSPRAVAKRVVELAEIGPLASVLEPSAGEGAIAEEAAGVLMSHAPTGTLGQDVRDLVKCYEVDPVAFGKLSALGYRDAERADFLEVPPTPEAFDRVVMNPPFTKGAAAEHVLHAYAFLKPGGILVSVMPGRANVFQLSALPFAARAAVKKAFVALLVEGRAHVENLPEGSFKESGTTVSTHLLKLTKPARKRATRR